MIKKFNNFGKINEDKTLDEYYDTFDFEGGVEFSTKPKYEMWVDDSEFEDFLQDMYKESID